MKSQNLGLILGIIVLGSLYGLSTGLIDFDLSDRPSVEEFDFPDGANKTTVYDKEAIYSAHVENLRSNSFSEEITEKITKSEESFDVSFDIRTDRKSEIVLTEVGTTSSNNNQQTSENSESYYKASNSNTGFEGAEGYTRTKTGKNEDYRYNTATWRQPNNYLFDNFWDKVWKNEMIVPPLNDLSIGKIKGIKSRVDGYYAKYDVEEGKMMNNKMTVKDGYILVGENSTVKEIKLEMKMEEANEKASLIFDYTADLGIEDIKSPKWIQTAKEKTGTDSR